MSPAPSNRSKLWLWFSVKEIANQTQSTSWYVTNAIASGELAAYRLGRVVRMRSSDVLDWADSRDVKVYNRNWFERDDDARFDATSSREVAVRELSWRLGLSTATVRRWLGDGTLPPVVTESAMAAWLDARRLKPGEMKPYSAAI